MEELVIEKNVKIDLAVGNLFEAIIAFDTNSCVVFANQKAQEILEIDLSLLSGRPMKELFANFLNEDFLSIDSEEYPVNLVIKTGQNLRDYKFGIRRPDSNLVSWCRLNATPFYSDEHELETVVINFIETGKSNLADANHIQIEEKFKQLIRNSFDMIVLLDTNGIQHFVSESCEKILGYTPAELINIPVIDEILHPEDKEKTIAEFIRVINKEGVGGVQYRHRHKNGGWVYLEAFGSNQIDNPYINAVVLNVRDITERKNAEKSLMENEAHLRELNATKDKFFSIIAHDLRSPFHSIVGFSDLLADHIYRKDYEGLEKFVSIIQNSSQLALDLLMNLLEWARSQTGKIEFNPEYFELVLLINKQVILFTDAAFAKSIILELGLPHNLPVFADKAMISTILRNLISNAIKFTKPGGKISISAEQKDETLLVSVTDNGVGINSGDIEKLFRIEESFSTIGTRKERGTGLGLIICKEFVDKHNGKFWVESKSGEGSSFKFTVPNQI